MSAYPTTLKGRRSGPGTFLWLVFSAMVGAGGFYGGYRYHAYESFDKEEHSVACIRVLDGDTFEVVHLGQTNLLRVIGIDSFETKAGKKLRSQAEAHALSEERALELGNLARAAAEKNLLGKQLTIRFESGGVAYDSFGRLLAYVYLDGRDYGKWLIRNGLAYPREEDHVRDKYYAYPVLEARRAKAGIYAPVGAAP